MKSRIALSIALAALLPVAAFAQSAAKSIKEADKAGKKKIEVLTAKLTKEIAASKNASAKAKAFTTAKLLPQCTNSEFVKAVKLQNAKKVKLDAIKKIDKEWRDAEEPLAIHGKMLGGPCAKAVKKIIKANPMIVEAFVTDNQGANVGQNALTSDYWQGDEAKWKNSFKKGQGGVEIGEREFDKSANAELQQISLPIIATDGKVIGAVTYGVNLSKLK